MEVTLWEKYKTTSKRIMKEKKVMQTLGEIILSVKHLMSIWDVTWELTFRDNRDAASH